MNTITGSPQALRRAADALQAQAGVLEGHASCVSTAQGTAAAQWKGAAATEFTCATTTKSWEARQAARVLRDIAGAVRTFAGDLERHQGEQRRIVADLATQKQLLRDLERDRQVAGPGEEPLGLSREISATTSQIKRLHNRHDQLGRDHRLAVSKLKSALSVAQPPASVWRTGARAAGLGFAYWTLWSQGSAARTIWQTRDHTHLPPDVQAKHQKAVGKVQKGPVSGLSDRDRVKVFLEGKGKWLKPAADVAGRFGMAEAVAPGVIDVVTGGGYSGWRGGVTRVLGAGQVVGVLASRVPQGRVPGAVAIVVWAAWKAGNGSKDNRNWMKAEFDRGARNGDLGLAGMTLVRVKLPERVPGNGTLTPAATAAVAERRLQRVYVPNRSVQKLDTSFMRQGPPSPDRLAPGATPQRFTSGEGTSAGLGRSR